jgi:hypothetical protein
MQNDLAEHLKISQTNTSEKKKVMWNFLMENGKKYQNF